MLTNNLFFIKTKQPKSMKAETFKKTSSTQWIISISLMLLFVLLIGNWAEASALGLAVVIPGMTTGKLVSGEPLTTSKTLEHSPSLLQSEIDNRIVKIRPMSTPVDQISRYKGARKAGSMIVDYYSVDVKPTKTTMKTAYTEPEASAATANNRRAKLDTNNNDLFEISDTILVQGVKGYESDGVTPSQADLVLYVYTKDLNTGAPLVNVANGKTIGSIEDCVPTIPAGACLIRMGRAAAELDVQTAQFESLPVKEQNYCQIFKMQIEQSTLQKIANKEVEWDFSDQEEAAIYDMRLGMEKTFMFGVKHKVYDTLKKDYVNLTGGIWWQAGKQYEYDPSVGFTQNDLVDMMQMSFTGNAGNKRKVLIGGSDFIGRINKIETVKIVEGDKNTVKWGIDFNEISSKFGKLYVLYSEVFDDCGMHDYGFIFDPEFIQKWSHVPFGAQELDLKKAGVRNTDALVLTEASCLTLRYPAAHMRIEPLG